MAPPAGRRCAYDVLMAHSNPEVTPTQRGIGKVALLAVVLALVGNVLVFAWLSPYGNLNALSPLAEARKHIHDRYVGEIDDQTLIDAALKGMADAMGDKNTEYFSAERLAQFNEQVKGEFTGIGAEIGIQDDRLMIISPLDDSPAMKAGLMPGDIVLEIDGQSTLGVEVEEAVARIKGKSGTTVKLKVRHPDGTVQDVVIERAKIKFSTVRGFRRTPGNGYDYMLDPQRKIAYLRLTQFGEASHQEVEDTLTTLKSQGMNALILDLRNNGGGLLQGATEISDLFLTGGKTIVSTKGKGTSTESIVSTNDTMLPDLPLVVLINEYSASASEILAGAMLDNERALLVGSRSYGKGSVQQLLPLSRGTSAIKLTTAYWYLPSGKMIHRKPKAKEWGVDPSPGCFIPMDGEQIRAMLIKRRESDVQDSYADLDEPVSPAWLRDEMLDAPMAAALEAARQMLTSDGWPRVGIERDVAFAKPTEREALEKRRQELLGLLDQVNEDLKKNPDEEAAP